MVAFVYIYSHRQRTNMAKQTRPVLTDESIHIAERRVHELSKPGKPMNLTAYINKLIEADGRKHPKK